jgi:hypothetical protein
VARDNSGENGAIVTTENSSLGATKPLDSDQRDCDRLEGWKAIAAHFDRDIRTVQRWEQTEGLPIRRHNHSRQASAYALASELNEWRLTRMPDQESDAQDIASTGSERAVERTNLSAARVSPLSLLGRHRGTLRLGLGAIAMMTATVIVVILFNRSSISVFRRQRLTDSTSSAPSTIFIDG